ncbi:MAG: GNAT family N-acetyltransferase [Cyanobacteria bacterium P01_D01_bin.71]
MIVNTTSEHREPLLAIIEASGQFDADGLAHVQSTLDAYFANQGEAIWLTALEESPVGVAYCAPEPVTSGTWNLLMLWIKDGFEGRGFGKALVSEVENQLKQHQARLLIVETSQLPEFETARAFYERSGFKLEAEVKNFFDAGDNKLIYTKPLNVS